MFWMQSNSLRYLHCCVLCEDTPLPQTQDQTHPKTCESCVFKTVRLDIENNIVVLVYHSGLVNLL